jgi:nucleoside transporter
MPFQMRIKLSAMMFLQFMMLPVWFVPMFPYVKSLAGGEDWAFWCGLIMGFGMLASPLFGMFADRFLNSEKVLALCNFVCAGLLSACYFVKDPALLFFLLLAVMIVYMPSWSLTATIAMANSTTAAFPQIRVFGSLGWVASAIFSIIGVKCFGIANFDSTPCIFAAGAIAAALGGFLAFLLPATPPKAKGTPMSVVDALGLRALSLLKDPVFLVFAVLLFLAMVPFQWYMVYNPDYLKESGFKYLTVTQNLGQVGELCFMLLIPVLLKKFGYKWAMVIGLGALAFRYGCFYASAAAGIAAFDFGGILVHGLIFGLLIIGAQMYVDDFAPAELRNQAQGLVMLITGGIGVFASNFVFQKLLDANIVKKVVDGREISLHNWSQPFLVALIAAVVLTVLMAICFNPKKKAAAAQS